MTTTTKRTNTFAIEQGECQDCGAAGGVHWIDSSEGVDRWACTKCGYQGTIPIDEPGDEGRAFPFRSGGERLPRSLPPARHL